MVPPLMGVLNKIRPYLTVAVGAGALLWLWRRQWSQPPHCARVTAAAFITPCAPAGAFSQVRDAGPQFIRDEDGEDWDAVDQASDESFPASDPPSFSLPKQVCRTEQD